MGAVLAVVLFAGRAGPGGAQQRFTTQILMVPAFRGADRGLASKASDVIRSRVAGAFPRNELKVISGGDMDDWLRLSGFEENAVLNEGELREMAKKFRADERITGVAVRTARGVRVDAALTLIRDVHLTQPFVAEAPSVELAAEAVARDVVAARHQLVPLRECENFVRAGRFADAAQAAATGIAAYPRAVPARICLLNALARLDARPDSIIAVARAALSADSANAAALGALAQALDVKNDTTARDVWVRLLATDSSNADLIERVVNALARDNAPKRAAPIIDRATHTYPDNLALLKLRWLVHLAENDWPGAIEVGEQLLARDPASQANPEFYLRLASAYRADSQPARALGVAATGTAKFPHEAGLYVLYLQLLQAENAVALTRGLAAFPDNAELHVLAAQSSRTTGKLADAVSETKRALTINPTLPHGYLRLAQLEIDAGQPDSALTAIDQASAHGEPAATVADFALARGNALYKAATASQQRDDYLRAMRFLALAERMSPKPESKFLLGASALSVSQSAATEAATTKNCELSRLAESNLTDAEINLVSGGSVAPDAAKQYLDYVSKLRPYVADQIKTFCGPAGPPR